MLSNLRAWDTHSNQMHHDFQIIRTGFEPNDTVLYTSDKQPLGDGLHWVRNDFFSDHFNIMEFSGLYDSKNRPIFENDIIELVNASLETIQVICKKGIARREVMGLELIEVDIPCFYLETPDGFKSFPIVNNYLDKHDTELFNIVGNTFQGILTLN